MSTESIKTGVVHRITQDIKRALQKQPKVLQKWNDLTPLARNEWICWVTIVKQSTTRAQHVERMIQELQAGKKRPCCWPGCPHRRPSAAKWFGPRPAKK